MKRGGGGNSVDVLIGITTGHSNPFELWIVTSSTASFEASMRPSERCSRVSQSDCRSLTKA